MNYIKLNFKKLFYINLLFSLLLTGKLLAQSKGNKPNILILMADDMGYGDIGVYGSQKIPTPNIDKLAEEGMYFTDAHSPGATCTPARYGFLTGRYYWRSNISAKGGYGYATPRIESEFTTLPEFLKVQGYHTGGIGKWHLGLQWGLKNDTQWSGKNGENIDFHKTISNGPLQHGFDYYFGIAGSLDMPPYVFIENNHTVGIPSVDKNPKNTLQWNRGGLMVPGWKDEVVGAILKNKAKEFILDHVKHHSDEPFFLYYAATEPHTPCVPPDFVKGKSLAGVRGDMVVEFDWVVGEIVQLLKDLNLSENTILIVTSDNGGITDGPSKWGEPLDRVRYNIDHHGHKPNGVLRGQKSDIWEGGSRIPFIMRWPSYVSSGTVNRNVISLLDLYSTFADILKKPLPDQVIDSYNILPALVGEDLNNRSPLILEAPRTGLFGIRMGSWKFIDGRGSGGFTQPVDWLIQQGEAKGQLYNLDTDLSESMNLWSSHSAEAYKLKLLLDEFKDKK